MIYDSIIIGGGAAGLTAAIYARRSGLSCLMFEKFIVGGQTAMTYQIDNYPGFLDISGGELMEKIHEQASNFSIEILNNEVIDIVFEGKIKKVITSEKSYECKTIIIATGAKPKKLEVKGEKEFTGAGVSYCATCDGAFFKGKDVVVVGSGNTAVEDALFLSRFCTKVYILNRGNKFKCDKVLYDNLILEKNIEIVYNTSVKEIMGNGLVESVKILENNSLKESILKVSGVFVAIGVVPNSNIGESKIDIDKYGYIITDKNMMTSVKGIFAAGDGRNTPLRQIITAASDGAIAAYSASVYIANTEK